MLDNAIAVVNGKGGVGKSSCVANMAVTAALSDWKVLAVDLDAQGNLARDLGYRDRSDGGERLLQAVMASQPVEPLRDIRPGLDVIPGGAQTKRLADLVLVAHLRGDTDYDLNEALAPTATDYDLVLIDCPPASSHIVRTALRLAHYALIPTKPDDASIDGLEGLAAEIQDVVGTDNPDLYVLGVVLFDVGAGDGRLRADTRAELEEMLDGIAPLLTATIRHSRRGARDMRRRGEVAAEYERASLDAKPWYLDQDSPKFSTAAGGLAGDYQQLTQEVLSGFLERRRGVEQG